MGIRSKKNMATMGMAAVVGAPMLMSAIAAAAAESEPAADTGSQLETIIVTAQKRTENLQDVPISIRALSDKELERLGANGLEDFSGFAPSLNLIGQGPQRTQINMRGVATGDLRFDRPEVRETVGLYLDETPISTQVVSPNLGLLDIERIEVLRGPQGTLYGAGSLSGTVRMITRKPNLQEFQGSAGLDTSVTQHGSGNVGVNGVVNLPLADGKAGVRLVGFYNNDSGFIDNISTGRDNINWTHQYGGRASFRFKPTDAVTLDASLMFQESHLGGDFSYREEGGDLVERTLIREPSDSRIVLPSLIASFDLGSATITSATSFYKKDTTFLIDIGRFAELLLGTPDNPFTGPNITAFNQKEFTQELRLSARAGDSFSYTVGAFFQHQDNGFGQDITFPGIDAAAGIDSTQFGANPDQIFRSAVSAKTDQYAAFGEATIDFTKKLSLIVGGRAFKAKQDSTVDYAGIFTDPLEGRTAFKFDGHGFNPKVNLTYKINDADMVYAQASKGFRLGGTNEPIPATFCAGDLAALGFSSPPPSFDSDTLWNYEAGAKTSWAGGRLTANGAVYYIDWKGPPIAADLACGFSTEINIGAFKIQGVEFDLEARPISSVVLRLGGAYNHGKLAGDAPILGGKDGDRVPGTPRFTFNTSVDYDFPVALASAGARGFLHADYRFVGDRVTLFPNSQSYNGYYDLPSYNLVGLRAGVSWNHVSAEAYVDNALDTRAVLNKTQFYRAYDKVQGISITTNRPRTVGLKFGYVF